MKKESLRRQKGFSLAELLVAGTVFLVVMSAVFGVLQIGGIARDTVNNSSETINNARISINSVGRDAINAGLGYSRVGAVVPDDAANNLLGIPQDTGFLRDVFTSVMAGDEVSTSILSVGTEKNDVVAFMYRDLQFNGGNPIVVNSVNYTNDEIDMNTAAGDCAVCNDYDLYLVESGNGNHALAVATDIINSNSTIRVNFNDPLGINRKTSLADNIRSILTPCGSGETANCFSYSPQATVKRVFLTSYSVNPDGTLVRKTYGNNVGGLAADQIREIPLAYNVQRFQVRYLLQDGTITDDPSNANNNQGILNEIIQVEAMITIKPDQNQGQVTSTQILNLSSTFSTRNIKYDGE